MEKEIRVINLDRGFSPIEVNVIEYESFKFSGGELHIKLDNEVDYSIIDKVIITHRIKSSDDLMLILITKNALELKGIKEFELVIPYVPYARQDRKCFNGESFTLKVFTDIINSANFNMVHIFDSHSDVAPALINNCINHDNKLFIKNILTNFTTKPTLISPDAGSNKKANKLAIDFGLELVKCDKVRDTKTGNLSGFEVFSVDLKGKDCLIVDDICDGGGTFIGLTNELKKKNCGDIYLAISHGIFSKPLKDFEKYLKKIYTTDSWRSEFEWEQIERDSTDLVEIIKLKNINYGR